MRRSPRLCIGLLLACGCKGGSTIPDAAEGPPIVVPPCLSPNPKCPPPPPRRDPSCQLLPVPIVTSAEAAARIGRWLWGGDGSEAVTEAARMNLHLPSDRGAFVNQLLADPRGAAGFAGVVDGWLELGQEPPEQVPPALWSSMREETGRFLWHTLVERESRGLDELLLANYTFVDPPLARHYGLAVAGEGWRQVPVRPEERGGLLTHGSILARHPGGPGRGLFVLEKLDWCVALDWLQVPGHPDPSAESTPARAAVTATYAGLPQCQECHHVVDGPGWPLQSFDELGRFRAVDGDGAPVDARGWIATNGNGDIKVSGHGGLAEALAQMTEVRACVADQVLAHAAATAGVNLQQLPRKCVFGDWDMGGASFRQLLAAVADLLALDWPRADGGVPEAGPLLPDAGADGAQ